MCNAPVTIVTFLIFNTVLALCEIPGGRWWGQSADHPIASRRTCLTWQCVIYCWESHLCLSHILIASILIKWLTVRGIFKLETNKMSPWLEWRWRSGERWDLKGRERINSPPGNWLVRDRLIDACYINRVRRRSCVVIVLLHLHRNVALILMFGGKFVITVQWIIALSHLVIFFSAQSELIL